MDKKTNKRVVILALVGILTFNVPTLSMFSKLSELWPKTLAKKVEERKSLISWLERNSDFRPGNYFDLLNFVIAGPEMPCAVPGCKSSNLKELIAELCFGVKLDDLNRDRDDIAARLRAAHSLRCQQDFTEKEKEVLRRVNEPLLELLYSDFPADRAGFSWTGCGEKHTTNMIVVLFTGTEPSGSTVSSTYYLKQLSADGQKRHSLFRNRLIQTEWDSRGFTEKVVNIIKNEILLFYFIKNCFGTTIDDYKNISFFEKLKNKTKGEGPSEDSRPVVSDAACFSRMPLFSPQPSDVPQGGAGASSEDSKPAVAVVSSSRFGWLSSLPSAPSLSSLSSLMPFRRAAVGPQTPSVADDVGPCSMFVPFADGDCLCLADYVELLDALCNHPSYEGQFVTSENKGCATRAEALALLGLSKDSSSDDVYVAYRSWSYWYEIMYPKTQFTDDEKKQLGELSVLREMIAIYDNKRPLKVAMIKTQAGCQTISSKLRTLLLYTLFNEEALKSLDETKDFKDMYKILNDVIQKEDIFKETLSERSLEYCMAEIAKIIFIINKQKTVADYLAISSFTPQRELIFSRTSEAK